MGYGSQPLEARCYDILSSLTTLLLIFFSSFSSPSHGADVLRKGQRILEGESLVSAGGNFELGFFSPGSSKNRYVGIWYYDIPGKTVVWVANREAPIHDRSGSFSLTDDGSLEVLDGAASVVWSSNTSSASNDSFAQLKDDGNFVLRGGAKASQPAWQSFDNPGDTSLPGMQVGLDLKTNVNTLTVSWKSADDPSQGRFSMGIDPRRIPQLLVWEGTNPRWRSGPWNGQMFIGVVSFRPQYLNDYRFSNVAAEQKMYFSFNALNQSKERFVINSNGTLEDWTWNEENKEWQLVVSVPRYDCHLYNHCGDYGICKVTDTPVCSCLWGYEPRFSEDWNKGNWSGGCLRRTPLGCQRNSSDATEKGDGFLKLEGIKLPDTADRVADAVDAYGCELACSANCSCNAYAFVNGIGCMTWGAGLVDVQQFTSGGQDLYLKLAGSELAKDRKIPKIIIAASAAGAAALIISILFLFKCRRKIRELLSKEQGEIPLIDQEICHKENQLETPELTTFSFQTLKESTDNFSPSNMIGQGGFGSVYKGVLQGGQEIAVKRLSMISGQGMEEFKNEVILIAKLQHRNLVRLLGCCIKGDEKLLVYNYMVNRSLDRFLFDSTKRGQLDWKQRYNIIEGIARGLLYLHRDSRLRIIHRDLKTSNILLDEVMNPKISDFGMARIFSHDGDPINNTKRVAGTYGYMSPEYAMKGQFSVKSDVYSFGVILLEILSGKSQNFHHPETSANLLGYAWTQWNENNVMEFVDPQIRENCSSQEAFRCLQIGLLCVQDNANDRPIMPSVVVMLESDSAFLPQPKQPIFTVDGSLSQMDSSSGNPAGGLSMNYISTTVMIGR